MVIFQILTGFLLYLLPKKTLGAIIFKKKHNNYNYFYFSGRTALFLIGKSLIKSHRNILVPDYTCNVVNKAFVEAGFNIIFYRTNNLLEPDIEEIKRFRKKYQSLVLCLVPMMGAEGGVNWAFSKNGKDWRSKNQVPLIIDFCQDYTRFREFKYNKENVIVVTSFNDKSFWGVMGAAVRSDLIIMEEKPSIQTSKLILIYFFKKLIDYFFYLFKFLKKNKDTINHKVPLKFEYSYCENFPYDFRHRGATKLQIALAASGALFSKIYLRQKKKYIIKKLVSPLETPHYKTSAYAIVHNIERIKLRIKPPYALNQDPKRSQKPDLLSVHFKGFMDFS